MSFTCVLSLSATQLKLIVRQQFYKRCLLPEKLKQNKQKRFTKNDHSLEPKQNRYFNKSSFLHNVSIS